LKGKRYSLNYRLLETKFHIPPWREEGVTRTRLLDRLDAGLAEFHKLTLVSAPAGYGKTTLIVNWIHSLEGNSSVAWISLDEGDNEPARFMDYWLSAFRSVDESVGQNALNLLSLPHLPPLQMILDELLNDLVALEVPTVIVLDDYHTITNLQIHEAIEYFIEHQPAQIHLVITTREDPPFSLSRMRARFQMTEIRANDLRFTQDETQQFFNQSMHLKLAAETISTLEARTEGWAAGLQLAALALQNLPDSHEFIRTFHGTHRYILDYLAEEVLRQQDEETRNFLFQTAVLEKFNAPLCNAVTGRSDSQDLLLQLEHANLFIIPLDNERIWYRYHHLFADYLRTGLTKLEQAQLQEKASHWYEENDLVFEAVKHAFLSQNMEMTANVIERVIQKPSAWSGGEISTLVGWLDALPAQLLQSKPALCLHASRAWYIAGRINLSEKYLDLAEHSLKESSTSDLHPQTLLAISAERRAALAAIRGDLSFAIERATYSINQLPEDDLYDRARAGAMLGLAYGLKGDLEKASHYLINASDIAHTAGVSFMTMMARCEAALMQITQGKLHLATQTVHQAIQLAGGKQIPPLGFAWYVLAEIAWEQNELSSAEHYLMDGIEISKQGVLIDDLRYELMMLANLKKSTGDLKAALSAIEQAHSICQSFDIPRLVTLSSAHRVRIQLASGMLDRVDQWAQEYQELRNSHSVEYTREYEDLTLARILLANGDHDQALEILTPLFEQANVAGRSRTCIEAAILLSLTYRAQNKPLIALEWLAKALTLAEPEGFLRLFLEERSLISELLPKVRQVAPRFVGQLLQAFSIENASQKTLLPGNNKLIDPLSEQELRVLNLIVLGKSNQEIAEELFISIGTAKWHVHNVFQKLGVNNRPQAIALARDMGL
jgi:LuxR family transcriptional regulator, maltose regulon positive regulatory protein